MACFKMATYSGTTYLWSGHTQSTWLVLTPFVLSVLYLMWGILQKPALGTTDTGVAQPVNIDEDERLVPGSGPTEVPFEIGEVHVTKIYVHPIKSCRGTSVEEVRYDPEGLENDRKWCIIDAQKRTILTARGFANMVLITPRLEPDPSSAYGGQLVVSFPEGSGCESFAVPIEPTPDMLRSWELIEDAVMHGAYHVDGYVCQSLSGPYNTPSTVLSTYLGRDVHLMIKGPTPRTVPPALDYPDLQDTAKLQDGYPLLVASDESLVAFRHVVKDVAQKGEEAGVRGFDQKRWSEGTVEMERFRPNIVFGGAGVPFAEDYWRRIAISSPKPTDSERAELKITLISKCARCLLPNVDTVTGVRDAAVPYKVLMTFRTGKDPRDFSKPCFGVNGIIDGHGMVRVGDVVTVREWAGPEGV